MSFKSNSFPFLYEFLSILSHVVAHTQKAYEFNPVQKDKTLYLSKLKAFANKKVNKKLIHFVFRLVRNVLGKVKISMVDTNICISTFLTFFSKSIYLKVVQTCHCVVRG